MINVSPVPVYVFVSLSMHVTYVYVEMYVCARARVNVHLYVCVCVGVGVCVSIGSPLVGANWKQNKITRTRMQEPEERVQVPDVRLGGLPSPLFNHDAEPSGHLAYLDEIAEA